MLDFLRWPLSSIRGIYQSFPSTIKTKTIEIEGFQLNPTTAHVSGWAEKNEQFTLPQGYTDMPLPTELFSESKHAPTSMYDLYLSVPTKTLNISRPEKPTWYREFLWQPFALKANYDFGGITPTAY